jgi:hypothetical protein
VLRDFFLRNRLSARETARLASSSTHSGARGVEDFARAGAGGKFPGNMARDIMRAVRKGVKWPSPYWVSLPIKDRDGTMSLERVPVLLPHETFNFIVEHTPAERHRSFFPGPDSFLRPLVAEWAAELQVDPEMVCPVGLHGDGVPFAAKMRDTLEQLSWNFCTNHSGSRVLFAGLPKSCVGEGTVDGLLQVYSWSLRCCALGQFPGSRHDGSAWKQPEDKARAARANEDMKYRAAVLQIRADWDWLKKIYNFPSWATTGICWRCGAERRQGDLCFKDTGPDAPWRGQRYSGEQFLRMQRARGMASPLWGCPGLKVEHVVIDWMHCVDLGVGQDCLGQCFWDLLPQLAPGASTLTQVRVLWDRMTQFYKATDPAAQLSWLTPEMLRTGSKPPKLRSKAGEARYLYPFAAALAAEYTEGEYRRTVARLMQLLLKLAELVSSPTLQVHLIKDTSMRFALLYSALEQRGIAQGRDWSWRMKPKLHMLQELLEYQVEEMGASPSEFWVYRDESWCGWLGTVGGRRGGRKVAGTVALNLIDRFRCSADELCGTEA